MWSNNSDFYSGSANFESRLRHELLGLRLFIFSFRFSREIPEKLKLFYIFFISFLKFILPVEETCSELSLSFVKSRVTKRACARKLLRQVSLCVLSIIVNMRLMSLLLVSLYREI